MQRHYPGAGMLSEKHMALVGLAVCCGRIYAPRAAIVLGVTKPPEPARPAEPEGPRNIVVDQPIGPVADPGAWFDPGGAVQ